MTSTKGEISELVKELESYKGKHTELITVYIPAGYDPNSVQKQLEAEKATAKNIKSTATRKNVIDALDKIIRELKPLKKAPGNGLALFCGNISQVEGQQDLQFWEVEPPKALNTRLYRCDKEFVLDPLKEMLEVEEVFGLLVMDRKEATIGLLEGKRIEVLQKMTSGIPSQIRAGGQCLSPKTFIETKEGTKKIGDIKVGEELKAYDLHNKKIVFTKVKNKWKVDKNKYLEIDVKDCRETICSEDHTFFKKRGENIIEVSAKDLEEGDYLISLNSFGEHTGLSFRDVKSIEEKRGKIDLIDIETEVGNFFANGLIVHNSSQRFHRITEGLTKEFYKRVAEQMKITFSNMPKLKGIIVGGPVPTKDEFLDNDYLITPLKNKVIGRIDTGDTSESGLNELVEKSGELLAQQEITKEKEAIKTYFTALKESKGKATIGYLDTKKALEYGAAKTVFVSVNIEKDIQKELIKLSESSGAKITMISMDTTEGQQFYNLSGIGSILRFKF